MAKENDFYQVSLKAILKNEKGEVLVLGGLDGGSFEGFYDLPGVESIRMNSPCHLPK